MTSFRPTEHGATNKRKHVEMAPHEPYYFEPERIHHPKDEEKEDNENNERVQGTFWCISERCEVMPTPKECLCFREYPGSENKMEGTICTCCVVV